MWRQPWFLPQGPVLGAPCRRVTLATDTSLTGRGAVMSGHPARGLWSGHHLDWPCFRPWNIFFLPDLRDHHVWGALTTQRWSLTSTTKEVCGRTPCTGWCTRSLCGPRANSSHWKQSTSLGISTRKLYSLMWRLFTSWCWDRQLDPVHCPVGTVLEFLQAQLSTGLAHSTLKVYVAAISAYHASLGGQSVGKKPDYTFLPWCTETKAWECGPRFLLGTWLWCWTLSIGLPSILLRRFPITISPWRLCCFWQSLL